MNFKKKAEEYSDYIIEQRRFFHRCPELANHEVKTTKSLKEQLEQMGIPVTTFPDYYGLVGVIKGGKPGKKVMLRADIDALAVEEKTGLPFSSANSGKMHACGHDCHMAMLLGAAKLLADVRDELQGEVHLLFQSAEETAHGAPYYVEKGCLDDISAVFGMHIWNTLESPFLNVESGPRMASCDRFKITVEGKSAHGSAPHMANDALVASASIVMNLQTYVSRRNNPLNSLVVSVCSIHGGQGFNIIANHIEMEGTVRTYSKELQKRLPDELLKIIRGTAEALGCTADLEYLFLTTPIVNDHEDLNRIARDAAVKLYGEEALAPMERLMGAEDFSYFMDKVPGFYGFLGSRNEALGKIYPNHNDKYDVDESALQRGSAFYAQCAADFLEESAGK